MLLSYSSPAPCIWLVFWMRNDYKHRLQPVECEVSLTAGGQPHNCCPPLRGNVFADLHGQSYCLVFALLNAASCFLVACMTLLFRSGSPILTIINIINTIPNSALVITVLCHITVYHLLLQTQISNIWGVYVCSDRQSQRLPQQDMPDLTATGM